MAEGGIQSVTCRYFLNGACNSGDNCTFSHNRQNSRPSSVCRYYLRGVCSYGTGCRYDHVRPQNLSYNTKNSLKDLQLNTKKSSKIPGKVVSTDENFPNKFTILSPKSKNTTAHSDKKNGDLRADAPEFVPNFCSKKTAENKVNTDVSFALVCGGSKAAISNEDSSKQSDPESELCPYMLFSGKCSHSNCGYVHGLVCDMCQLACLHPHNKTQRGKHIEECTKLMEAEMEHSFAIARSLQRICGICMETVVDPDQKSKKRFGILPNCNHCFCLDCMRQWRKSKQFENKIVRSCPECRVQSDYVIPSLYWVDDKEKEEKEKLMVNYKKALSNKPCKYFKQGVGECPFGNKCFYMHALPDGTKKDVGPPKRRKRINADGELQLFWENTVLSEFISEREHRLELIRDSIQSLMLEWELDDMAEDLYFPDDSLSVASDV